MEVLLMYMDDHQLFDSVKVKESFRALEEVVQISEADWLGENVECICEDETHIRLSADKELIAIQGDEDSSLRFALEIQKQYGGRFHLTDSEGVFDTFIDGSQNYEDISRVLRAS